MTSGRRILVTGLGSMLGSMVARTLEQEPSVDVVVGVDTDEPRLALDATEFVRSDSTFSMLNRIVRATRVDTIVHAHSSTDSAGTSSRRVHDRNVIGTGNVVAAAAAVDGSVRKVVAATSTHLYGCSFDDPYWFREDTPRRHGPRTHLERCMVEADAMLHDLDEDERRLTVTRLRFADVLGPNIDSPFGRLLRLPVVPEILGFDPRLQFVHEDDAVHAIAYATINHVPGVYNVAGAGTLPWSEVCAITERRRVPLPPLLTDWVAMPLRRSGVAPLSPDVLRVLRYGRGVDPARFRREGFRYQHTTVSTVEAFAAWLRLRRSVGDRTPEYRYERDVETFLRHSPAVVRE